MKKPVRRISNGWTDRKEGRRGGVVWEGEEWVSMVGRGGDGRVSDLG